MWALVLVAFIWGLTNACMKAFSASSLGNSKIKLKNDPKTKANPKTSSNLINEIGYYISFAINLMGSALYYKSIGDIGMIIFSQQFTNPA